MKAGSRLNSLNPNLSLETKSIDEMDRDFWNDAYRENPDHAIAEDFFLSDEVEGLQPGTALDLGCGTGLNALMLAERGWSVVGFDWAEHAIELAAQAVRDRGLDATYHATIRTSA